MFFKTNPFNFRGGGQNSMGDCDMALALNRYLCNAVLPLLTNNSHFFRDADYASHLLDQTLHTAYQLSKCRSLTKNQRDVVSDFLVALSGYVRVFNPRFTRRGVGGGLSSAGTNLKVGVPVQSKSGGHRSGAKR